MLLASLGIPPYLVQAYGEEWPDGWTYRRRHLITGSSADDVLDYQTEITVYYGAPVYVRGQGAPIVRNDLLTYDVDQNLVTMKHDLLDDPGNYSEIFPPPASGNTIAAGAGGFLYHDSVYYGVYRDRLNNGSRGKWMVCENSSDMSSWNEVWRANKDNIAGIDIYSWERCTIRHYGDYYYFYFCGDISGSHDWRTWYVKSSTVEGIGSLLLDSSKWTMIIPDTNPQQGVPYLKDPTVMLLNGTYYMLTGTGLYEDDNPEFSSPTFIHIMESLYMDIYGTPDKRNVANTILYDESSGFYIYWAEVKEDGDDIYWWYAVSTDMHAWTFTNRELVLEDWSGTWVTARYFDYHAIDDQRILITMEWDHDDDGDGSTVLWDYSGDAAGSSATKSQDVGSSVHLDGNCQSDFDDIRFTSADGETFLDYYLVEKVNGEYARFWVKIDSLEKSTAEYIYIYYGNVQASSTSTLDTFMFGDNFETDLSKWIEQGTGAITRNSTVKNHGSYSMRIEDDHGTDKEGANATFKLGPEELRVLWYGRVNQTDQLMSMILTNATEGANEGQGVYLGFQNDGTIAYRKAPSWYQLTNYATETWYSFEVLINITGEVYDIYVNDSLLKNGAPFNHAVNNITAIALQGGPAATPIGFFDDVFVCNLITPEPVHGEWFSEEIYVRPPVTKIDLRLYFLFGGLGLIFVPLGFIIYAAVNNFLKGRWVISAGMLMIFGFAFLIAVGEIG